METVHIAESESPIGRLRVASTDHGIAYVELPHASGRGMRDWLQRHAPGSRCVEDLESNRAAIEQILEYLARQRTRFELQLDLRGTPFQRAVWDALLDIPYGASRSYAEIARRIGRPSAQRAVGSANNANPVALVVPCHRVIAADGSLGGYAGGAELKARLLAMERSQPSAERML
ncbi:MAG TPA: methylated-DNA--[protein]-cysteine S-methyltransferase [Myxococcota bacterium]|nr:methylated-DNA--[protein]-cysteine S-methyltransferase [Myxococcota bacterium]